MDHVQIYSKAQLQIDPQVNVLQPTTDNDVARAMLRAFPDISSVEQPGVPIWVYILAGCAGLIVLIVIILLLWKVSLNPVSCFCGGLGWWWWWLEVGWKIWVQGVSYEAI